MNVMIAGIEASGKTVLLTCLYGLYARPDDNGYFLNPKDIETYSYLEQNLSLLRNEKWPNATNLNDEKLLSLELRSTEGALCEIPVRDFAGEVYVWAFGGVEEGDLSKTAQLTRQIQEADILLAIVNLRDLINSGELSEADSRRNWTTKSLFDYVAGGHDVKKKKLAIVLTQCDFYSELIHECGGPRAVIEKYLPAVAYVHKEIDVFAVSAVDKVEVSSEGVIVPARDFSSESLRPVMKWIIQRVEEVKRQEAEDAKLATERKEREAREQVQHETDSLSRGRVWRWSRPVYWCALFNVALLLILGATFFETMNIFTLIAGGLWMWASACRLRDCNCRGWGTLFAALMLVPDFFGVVICFAAVASLIIGCVPGTKGENRWGK